MAESSSKTDKPVIVRVKRKANQSRVDAFWLEINERPSKRPLIDFQKLSLSESSSTSQVEEQKATKILVRHLETVTTTSETSVVLSNLLPNSSEALKGKDKNEARRVVKTVNKQDELLLKSKRQQEVLSRNARFEQIWRSRTKKKESSEVESVYEMYRVYDVVRVDLEEEKTKMQEEKKNTDLEDRMMMSRFLPLLQKVLPEAAEEIEYDMKASSDGYVYDFYAVNDDSCMTEVDSTSYLPLVQVEDDDEFYDGPNKDSDYETDDSNAEDNPLNDYPEEEEHSSEDEDSSSKSSEEKSDKDESKTSEESENGESGADVDDRDDSRPWSDDEYGAYSDYGYGDSDCSDEY